MLGLDYTPPLCWLSSWTRLYNPKRTHAIRILVHPYIDPQSWSSRVSHTQNIPKPILRLPGIYEWVHYGLWCTKWVLYTSLSRSTFLSMHRGAFYWTRGMRLRLVHNIPQKSFKRRSINWIALRTLKYLYKQQSCT